MGTPPAAGPQATPATAQPVGVAILARTSTLLLQDPYTSLRRQLRACTEWLPDGWYIAGHYWDVESGAIDLENRSQGEAWKPFAEAGIPRDGGMAELLAEAQSPEPRFAAVVCEDIERSGRDTFNALKLERELSDQGIILFATDEPVDLSGLNPTTLLVRRIKQGIAEWYRLSLKKACWKGLREHTMDGYHLGPIPHGYAAHRIPHPVPEKRAQGRTKTRLILDPPSVPAVEAIFQWRTVDLLGIPTIAQRLNADLDTYPHEDGWTETTVAGILANPKYTGYMVFGQHRRRRGKMVKVPQGEWIWSPQPTHPAIITMDTWQQAQATGAERGKIQDEETITTRRGRYYLWRSHIHCKDCNRSMGGTTRTPPAGRDPATWPATYVYYHCPHNPHNPRHANTHPHHPRSVSVREDHLTQILATEFFGKRVFGPDRAALLAPTLPASAAIETQQREQRAATLRTELRRIDTAQNALITELEDSASADDPAIKAYRARIRERFTGLQHERTTTAAELDALTTAAPPTDDPTLLDELPLLPGLLDQAPQKLIAALLEAFSIQAIYNKKDHQVTIRAVLTDSTPQAVTDLLAALAPAMVDAQADPGQPSTPPAPSPQAGTHLWHPARNTLWSTLPQPRLSGPDPDRPSQPGQARQRTTQGIEKVTSSCPKPLRALFVHNR